MAVEFSDQLTELLRPLKEMDFTAQSEIHFVHVFRTITNSFGLGEVPLVYPIMSDRGVIEQSGLVLLASVSDRNLQKNFDGKVVHKVLFSDYPKGKFCEYVNEVKADLVIIPTKEKHGIFESSFAQYVNKHTTCNMILLKYKL